MSGELTAALSPEEWADGKAEMMLPIGGEPAQDWYMVKQLGADHYLPGGLHFTSSLACCGHDVPAEQRHSAAALCLNGLTDENGNALGFSWADVDFLDHMRLLAIPALRALVPGADAGQLQALSGIQHEAGAFAARIAALLPPRVVA